MTTRARLIHVQPDTVTQVNRETMTILDLRDENRRFRGVGGTSGGNSFGGFLPAFLDRSTGAVYLSRFADGRAAPLHLLDALPPELVMRRSASGRAAAVKGSVMAGFVHSGQFYTREQAATAVVSTERVEACTAKTS